jgi:hypothetical protein
VISICGFEGEVEVVLDLSLAETWTVRYKLRATPRTSKPGPRFEVEEGTRTIKVVVN